jgi:predicted nucleic acid-binding protein
MAVPSLLLVQLRQVISSLPKKARPSGWDPVKMSCIFGLSPRALMVSPFSLTSALTLGEILVKPVEAGDEVLGRRYEAALRQAATIIPLDVEGARLYARIRNDRTIRPPDAIQMACAAQARVDLFITNDERLSMKSIAGIQFVSSLQRAFL